MWFLKIYKENQWTYMTDNANFNLWNLKKPKMSSLLTFDNVVDVHKKAYVQKNTRQVDEIKWNVASKEVGQNRIN